ncbi:hypothetical protein CF319_g5840 [Tilletia indica]|uniref:Uncharacterized protein n=1 Tax=Tilletia indica TaxID=43049 RepID=A0A177TVD8_9BASI|nr:hypothetical protein CF319_g5840 [Tilletia indica]KAE8234555.1 hypothetical protein CF326_g402 [Tilletia indica]KAE8257333.1 hypothetical protein A4X13_0g2425 [Tilletia indica]
MFASVFRSAAAASRRSASSSSSSSSSTCSTLARRQLTTSAQLSADVASSAKATAEAAASGAKATAEATASSAKAGAEAAQSQLSNAAEKAKQLGGPYAERAQSLFSSITESVTYNLRTVGALAKQVYVAERLAPPTSTESILSAYKSIWAFASNPAQWTRLVQNGDWKKVGIYSVEALGIFTIGEMIGRRSIVGYSLNTKHHGHGHH